MCLAIPGKIVALCLDVATIDYGSELREAKVVLGDFSVGDFVLVSGGIVVEKVPPEQVVGWLGLLHET